MQSRKNELSYKLLTELYMLILNHDDSLKENVAYEHIYYLGITRQSNLKYECKVQTIYYCHHTHIFSSRVPTYIEHTLHNPIYV